VTLSREEYIEQAYFFGTLAERIRQAMPSQEVLSSIKEEILATTKLPMAIDFMAAEMRHSGGFAPAMARLKHYFTPFQTHVVLEAESERGRLEMTTALEILRREALYRTEGATPQGIFLYEFESLSRNRLGYDHGLEAVRLDPAFDATWRDWIRMVRRQVGLIDLADMIFLRSEYYLKLRRQHTAEHGSAEEGPGTDGVAGATPQAPDAALSDNSAAILFGEKEGRIAWANRRKDPLLLLSALQRQLGYPAVPRPVPPEESREVVGQLLRRLDKIEQRLKLVEEEQRGGIQIEKFFKRPDQPES
jgi:hypothetical protein